MFVCPGSCYCLCLSLDSRGRCCSRLCLKCVVAVLVV